MHIYRLRLVVPFYVKWVDPRQEVCVCMCVYVFVCVMYVCVCVCECDIKKAWGFIQIAFGGAVLCGMGGSQTRGVCLVVCVCVCMCM